MKICLISDRLPWPPSDGRRSTLYSFCKRLNSDWSHTIDLILIGNENVQNKPDFIENIYQINRPGIFEIAKNIFRLSLLRKKSLQSTLYYSHKIQKKISEITSNLKPDVVVLNMVRVGQFYPSVVASKKIIFDMDDCLSLRYKEMLLKDEVSNALGTLGASIFSKMSSLVNNKFVGRFLLNLESHLIENEEIDLIKNVNSTVLVNINEVNNLKQRTKIKTIFHIPNRIDTTFYTKIKLSNSLDHMCPQLVFHGVLKQNHNLNAIQFFLKDIFPIVLNKFPTCILYLIGNSEGLPSSIINMTSKNIQLTGYVEDLRVPLSKATVYVAPMLVGSGMKTKVLEAMSMGLPLVTTTKGVDGISVIDGTHCIIRDDPFSFAEAITDLITNQNKREYLSAHARELMQSDYDECQVMQKWNELIES